MVKKKWDITKNIVNTTKVIKIDQERKVVIHIGENYKNTKENKPTIRDRQTNIETWSQK